MTPPPIYRISICSGVYYINIPKANVRILCSAPADIVKHLIKRDLIRRNDINGMFAENGPNVILLSDLSIQNGFFSNLAEFPILQMLYRQGMIIPNHPNNTGDKPIIAGATDQVKSQLEYIHRGNYGLVTKEEMFSAGLSEKEAEDILKMKLKFAFGKFKSPKELIEPVYIENEPIEVKNNVSIERIGINIFKITYDDNGNKNSIEVDLNLYEADKYPSPYALGHSHIKRDYFSIINSGEGDGWNIAQPSMSSVIVFQGDIYLVDAGPNIDNTLKSLGIGLNEIKGIFHTHAHDDHFCGIISLMELDHKVQYYSTPLVRLSVMKKLLSILDLENEELLDKFFEFHSLKDGEWSNIDGLEVKPIFSPHPIETTLFQFRALDKDGYKTYYHMADITSFEVLDSMEINKTNKIGLSKEKIKEVKKNYLETTDVKKIDIGGGMIHGSYEDFIDDKSKNIILAHIANELNMEQKLLGSDVHFGTSEIMIENNCNLIFQKAMNILKTYFINTNENILIALLNNSIKVFNPKKIICRKDFELEYVYMIITGNISTINGESKQIGNIGFGSFIGEVEVLHDSKSEYTYRTESYSSLLCIPKNIFLNFIKNNILKDTYLKFKQRRLFLQSSSLFRDFLSGKVKNEVAKTLDIVEYKKGESIDNMKSLSIVHKGKIIIDLLDECIYEVKKGDFFGEEHSLYNTKTIFKATAKVDTIIYSIPSFSIKNIPMIVKKSLEKNIKMHKLTMSAIQAKNSPIYAHFTEEYNLDIHMIDKQNHKISGLINICLYIVDHEKFDLEILKRAVYNLELVSINHTKYQAKELEKYSFANIKESKVADLAYLDEIKTIIKTLNDFSDNDIEVLKTQILIAKNNFFNRISTIKEFKKSIKEYSI